MPKPALTDWAARTAADEAVNNWEELCLLTRMQRHARIAKAHTRDRDAAARRGTEVHRYAQDAADGKPVSPPDEIAGHVEQYIRFLDTIEPGPLKGGLELVVASRDHRYCGTADLIADMPAVAVHGERIPASRWLLEIKTTRSGVWPESALQLCAYQHADVFIDPGAGDDDAERPVDWLQIERCGVIWVGSDSWELRPVDTGPDVWRCFLRLRALYDDLQHKDDWIGDSALAAG